MKSVSKNVIAISFLLIASLWIFDSLMEFLWFNEGNRGFQAIFLALHDPHELLMRLMFVSCFLLSGIAISQIFERVAREQEATRKSEEDLRITLNSIGDAVIATDTHGRITRMNPVAETLTGWTFQEAKDKPLAEVFRIINAHTQQEGCNPVQKAIESGEIVGLANHTKLIDKQGREHHIADSAAPIRNRDGVVVGVVLVFRDQTDKYLTQHYMETRLSLIEYAANHSLDEFLTRALDEIGVFVDSPIGFYHFVEPDQKHLSLQQWSTRTLKEFCQAQGKGMHYPIDQAGVWVDCVHEKQSVVHNDYALLPHKKGLPDGHAMVIRELVAPVMREGKVVAILGVGNKPIDYTPKDVEIVSYLADVTWEIVQRMRVEKTLRENKQRMELAMRGAELGAWDWNITTGDVTFNERWAEMLGYTPNEIEPHLRSWEKLIHPGDKTIVTETLNAHLEGKTDFYETEHRMKHKSGDWIWVLDKGQVIDRGAHGEPLRACGTHLDITGRKQAEEALRESEKFLQNVFDALQDGLSVLDQDFTIVRTNAWMEKMYAHEYPLVGKKCYAVYQQRDSICPWCPSRKAIETEETDRVEVPYPCEENAKGWIDLSAFPIKNEKGELTGVIEYVKDISDRKRAEIQLQQAQKMESVGRLAGGVAHDFNNMLGVILGHAELAMNKVDPSDSVYANLQQITYAAERSANLTGQLLAFARKQTISPRTIHLNDTVESMLRMLQRLIGEDIELKWLPSRDIWPIRMDPIQIDQLLANLCVNSRDAIDGVGQITIETKNECVDHAYCREHTGFIPGEYVCLAVSDNGCGMDKDTLSQIFDPFFTTKKTGEGTGLGLATVYGIVKQNNGFINVYSEPGQGTTFSIYLPRYIGKSDPIVSENISKSIIHGRETVLLVEDEQPLLDLGKSMLEQLSYRVLTAHTPGEAINLAEKHSGDIHLLLTDVVMPEMNGRDLAKRILSLYPTLKRLFMSGYTANIIAHHGVLEEGVHFIQKPFTLKSLSEKVREALDAE